jgi:hypothetical protein
MEVQHTTQGNSKILSAVDAATLFADLVDILIPGDASWPSAASVGVHGVLSMRLSEDISDDCLPEVTAALLSAGGPFAGHEEEERIAIVALFAAQEPKLFERVRAAAVLAYYEHPLVVEAIRALGRPYSLRPHLTGYPMKPFDIAQDTPRHGRGFFHATEAVRPVDVAGLQLDEVHTEHWGINR